MTTLSVTEVAGPLPPLALGSVLAGSLPATLGTPDAPERYTIAAVFSRRPERAEVEAITGGATRDALSAAGYRTVELTVSDRRLEIANTHLDELRSGLATWLADRLLAITAKMLQDRADLAAARLKDSADERERDAAIALLAQSVTFAPSVSRG